MFQSLAPLWIALIATAMAAAGILGWVRSRSRPAQVAADLYGSIVAQARAPAFYSSYGVGDTLEGRFEMVVLHLFLVLERLRAEGEAGQDIGQALLERFVSDMDDQMREIGIGDLGVPRRIQKAAAAVRERVEDYRAGLASAGSCDCGLRTVLERHVGAGGGKVDGPALAGYMQACVPALARQNGTALLAGRILFPAPALPIGGRPT
jgi:cytochrome b pre-mRNA-processing protein 3